MTPDQRTMLLAILLLGGIYGVGRFLHARYPDSPPDCRYIAQKLTERFAMGPGDWRDVAECQSVEP